MDGNRRSLQALFGSAAIVGGATLGAILMATTVVAGSNFNKQQCRVYDPNVQGLAIDEAGASDCVCPPGSARRQLDDNQRPAGAASSRVCYIQTPQITNFNQPPTTKPPTKTTEPPETTAQKGNNGWGNGGDGENPGSDEGLGTPQGGPGSTTSIAGTPTSTPTKGVTTATSKDQDSNTTGGAKHVER